MDALSLLHSFGLSKKEGLVYLSLLTLGQASVREISKVCNLPRTTVYPFIEELVRRGLVVQEVSKRGWTLYSASPLDSFEALVNEERDALERKVRSLGELVKTLEPFFGKRRKHVPKLRFVEGKAAVEKLLYTAIHDWRKSYERTGDWTMWGYQDHTFVDEYATWHHYAWNIGGKRPAIKLFSTREGAKFQDKKRISNREIRPLPGNVEFPCSIWIHADHILFGFTASKPHFAILIVDVMIADVLRTLFRTVWEGTGRPQGRRSSRR